MLVLSHSRTWHVLVAAGLALLVVAPANSQTVSKRLAVLEFKGGGIKGDVLDAFSDEVRGGAVDALAGRGVQVMTRENMLVLLKEMGKTECSEGDCEVETARNIGADFVVSASVVLIDDEFVVTLKLHETKNGSLLATDRVNAKRKLDVLFKLREQGRKLVASNVGSRPQRGGAATGQQQPSGEVSSYREQQQVAEAARAAEAIVEFKSNPDHAVVRIDDALLCSHTPCQKLVGIGRHTVTFEKERYLPATKQLDVPKAGTRVELKLDPMFGWLSVQTVPAGVAVKINDEAARPAPIERQEREPGSYRIAVDDDCYLKVADTVRLERGQEMAKKIDLEVRMVPLSVLASDRRDNVLRGRVEIDGRAMGEVPFSGHVPFCSKQAVVTTDKGKWSSPVKLNRTGENRIKAVVDVAPYPANSPTALSPSPALARSGGCAANQVYIPGGTFTMGAENLDKDSMPVHRVTLSPYCIDKTEVTVAAFRACVDAGGCAPPSATVQSKDIKSEDRAKWSQFCTWGKGGTDDHPMNCMDWNQAVSYCTWVGGRLPTEAEWEYAARGTDGRIYPWGNAPPDRTRQNACGKECTSIAGRVLGLDWKALYSDGDGWPGTAPAGTYPNGASPFGVLDMAGNVWEYTADGFAEYKGEAVTNPRRSQSGTPLRVSRGGGWSSNTSDWLRATFRSGEDPAGRDSRLGFRCARGPQ